MERLRYLGVGLGLVADSSHDELILGKYENTRPTQRLTEYEGWHQERKPESNALFSVEHCGRSTKHSQVGHQVEV
jgi:hypothetical protein